MDKLSLLILCLSFSTSVGDKLIFVQAVWRHGDRSPTLTFPSDACTVDKWPQGWGQLSPLGMQQHLNMGERLNERYVKTGFLPNHYVNHEVYVRSTDVNRTLISAMSNMITMFPGIQGGFPDDARWPKAGGMGWVPVPIHTLRDDTDYTLNPDMDCPRQTELWNMIKSGPEYTGMQKDRKDFFDYLSNKTGVLDEKGNPAMTPEILWIVADALFIELQNNKSCMAKWAEEVWQSTGKTIYQMINETNDIVEYWNNGLDVQPIKNIDFSIEIPKIRGGSLLWSMIGHMQQKLYCLSMNNATQIEQCLFFNSLKYYAYSAHDTTIAALFSVLGFKRTNWNVDGYPHYSSAVTVELWQTDNGTNYVKFIYFPLNEPEEDVTSSITNCGNPCTLDNLVKRSQPYKPTPNAATLCATPVFPDVTTTTPPNGSALKMPSIFVFFVIFLFVAKNQL